VLLNSSDRRLARLRFVYAAREAAGVPLFNAVVMPDAAFATRFEGHARWWAREQAGGGGGAASGGGGGAALS
jgi:hypothetical protein